MKRWTTLAVCAAVLGCATALAATTVAPAQSGQPAKAPKDLHARLNAFDIEGHRGARGLRPENTLAAFGKAMQLGRDDARARHRRHRGRRRGRVSHERRISTLECRDTAAATPGRPGVPVRRRADQGPDATRRSRRSTAARARRRTRPPIRSCGTQEAVPGTRMPTLSEVFELAERYGATGRLQHRDEARPDAAGRHGRPADLRRGGRGVPSGRTA